jgi:hypothetical protein
MYAMIVQLVSPQFRSGELSYMIAVFSPAVNAQPLALAGVASSPAASRLTDPAVTAALITVDLIVRFPSC